ncbi:MAG: hypothetical protein ACO3NZ_02580 [Pirellulales bacterium]
MMTSNTAFQMTYLHKRVTRRAGQEGLWDEATGESYQQLIEAHAVAGWRFVQAVPLGGESGAYEVVLARTHQYPPLVFAHIPKTGGTSVTKIVATYLYEVVQAPPAAVLQYGVRVPYSDLRPLRMLHRQVRFVGGHFGFDHLQLLLREDPFVLVTVRDPFARLFSILDHEYRVGVDVAEGETEQRKAYAAKMVQLIDGLRAATSRDPMRDLLLSLREVSIPTVDYVTYAGNCVATARLENTEIDAFGARLEGVADAGRSLGLADVRENTSPSRLFSDRDETFLSNLRSAFEEVFEGECAYVAHLRATVPSVFEDGVWERMLSALWRRPPAMAAEAAAAATRRSAKDTHQA